MFKAIIGTICILLCAITICNADPSVISAWFEPADHDLSSFNVRFDPFHSTLDTDSSIRVFFPIGSYLTTEGIDVKCTLHSNGNLRYYMNPVSAVSYQSKRKGMTVTYVDINFLGAWFNPDVHNLLIRCFGIDISEQNHNIALEESNRNSNSVFLAYDQRQYTLKTFEDACPDGKRF